ncbi:MAG: excisionase family DNA-binding protein [Chloroflexota bacterium]|nr:excisionase family DNA-binding protein [Chloroflexota bacterium]
MKVMRAGTWSERAARDAERQDGDERQEALRRMLEEMTVAVDRTDSSATLLPLLVRPEEAARLLNVSRPQLYQMLAANVIPSVALGRSRRIPLAALQRWVEEQFA